MSAYDAAFEAYADAKSEGSPHRTALIAACVAYASALRESDD